MTGIAYAKSLKGESMTEGMEHLRETYRAAGFTLGAPGTGRTLGWGYREGGEATLVYRLLSRVDQHGRVLAQRWASMLGGQTVVQPATLPTMIKVSRFDRFKGVK
jgi:hypothetical protein